MKKYRITATNHDSSNSTITIVREGEERANWSIKLLKQCGYQKVTKIEI